MTGEKIPTAAELDAMPDCSTCAEPWARHNLTCPGALLVSQPSHSQVAEVLRAIFGEDDDGGEDEDGTDMAGYLNAAVLVASLFGVVLADPPDQPAPGVLPSVEEVIVSLILASPPDLAAHLRRLRADFKDSLARAVLALLPGRSEAEVQEEAIRTFEDLYFGGSAETREWVAAKARVRLGLPPRADRIEAEARR